MVTDKGQEWKILKNDTKRLNSYIKNYKQRVKLSRCELERYVQVYHARYSHDLK